MIFGFSFFAISILPVLQLLPVGDTVMADRYTYIASIGLFYLAGEGFYWLWSHNKKPFVIIPSGILIIFFAIQTYSRCAVWQNGLLLWNSVIDRYKTVPTAYYNRGLYLFKENRDNEALNDFNRAIDLKHDYADAYNNRASFYIKYGRTNDALNDLNNAILYNKSLIQAYFNRGFIFYQKKLNEEALKDYEKVIELKPEEERLPVVYNLMALAFMNEKRSQDALLNLNRAIELRPSFAEAINNRGSLLNAEGRHQEAIKDFSAAIALRPNYAEAYFNRGIAELNSGNKTTACQDWQRSAALGYQPASQLHQINCK
jgi:tetratricopeptide (TPR) repeat protein